MCVKKKKKNNFMNISWKETSETTFFWTLKFFWHK